MIQTHTHRIKFPPVDAQDLSQSEAYFYVTEGGEEQRFRFHDYDKIYARPGLYEQVFYDRLKCCSPEKVGEVLNAAVTASGESIEEMRVLDLGAGNGAMGEVMKGYGASRIVGADIIEEARAAALRDRPGVYDDYHVADFTALRDEERSRLEGWSFNCLTSVAALGFGDIPPAAFFEALRLVKVGGWAAFNIKETFLDSSDRSGFSRYIRKLIFSEHLELHHLERYRHRLSLDGEPLFYFALVARKTKHLPREMLRRVADS
ncbi:methyltransferase domain-containing protein [bacterium]|nr:methyltransferase domain-containing protein [bacterium]